MKLKGSIPSNTVKIIELYNKIDSGALDTSPEFQRKLVWKKQHKYAFINTILLNYPFPEVYIASSDMDVESLIAKEIVVDGKQRITAIVDYIRGDNDFVNTTKVKSFANLTTEEKREFLNYLVTVKDLKDLDLDLIKEIFQRINSTDYALNSNERVNARYGDGEFTMFCKQIVDNEFNPTEEETDIILAKPIKNELNAFFNDNNVFTDNDKSRMFDVQFCMLVISTMLEGAYFGRSAGINKYLEKYNSTFPNFETILNYISKATSIISSLKFSPNSYWFNKANLFILLIELSKTDETNLDIESLESKLLDLEKKVDIYFTDEDITMITEDEKKYFEFARQGSNELAAREHRSKIIKKIIEASLKSNEDPKSPLSESNVKLLEQKAIDFAILVPTETGLKKGVIDAITSVREFLRRTNLHDYDSQGFGPDQKVVKKGKFVETQGFKDTDISLYRANGRGDYRIWFTNLNQFAKAKDELGLVNDKGTIVVLNLTKIDYSDFIKGL